MKIYVMTDSHLGHDKLVEWGGREDGFTDEVIKGVHNIDADLLIHLGDVCIGNDEHNHSRLLSEAFNCDKKVLVRGNHDNKSDAWYYKQGWDFVCRSFEGKFFGKKLLFTHAPVHPDSIPFIDHNIHGHLHGGGKDSHRGVVWYDDVFNIDVAPELRGYTPIKLEKLWS